MARASQRGRDGCRGHGRAPGYTRLLGERARLCILGSSLFFQPQTPIPAQPLMSPRTLRELPPCSVTQCSHLSNGNEDTSTASQRYRGDSQWLA